MPSDFVVEVPVVMELVYRVIAENEADARNKALKAIEDGDPPVSMTPLDVMLPDDEEEDWKVYRTA